MCPGSPLCYTRDPSTFIMASPMGDPWQSPGDRDVCIKVNREPSWGGNHGVIYGYIVIYIYNTICWECMLWKTCTKYHKIKYALTSTAWMYHGMYPLENLIHRCFHLLGSGLSATVWTVNGSLLTTTPKLLLSSNHFAQIDLHWLRFPVGSSWRQVLLVANILDAARWGWRQR